ncbi:hypothetical protein [Aeromonas salmonicida]|nr:hypothetical protein [Aeromonas salmonicida]
MMKKSILWMVVEMVLIMVVATLPLAMGLGMELNQMAMEVET